MIHWWSLWMPCFLFFHQRWQTWSEWLNKHETLPVSLKCTHVQLNCQCYFNASVKNHQRARVCYFKVFKVGLTRLLVWNSCLKATVALKWTNRRAINTCNNQQLLTVLAHTWITHCKSLSACCCSRTQSSLNQRIKQMQEETALACLSCTLSE